MAEEDDSKKQHVIFGSAGMAASGMMPGQKLKRKPQKEEPSINEAVEEKAEEVISENIAPQVLKEEKPESSPLVPPPFTGLRAVIAGHSGAGDFGHGLDSIFQRLNGVRLSGLYDGNEDTLEDTKAHTGAPVGYADFKLMLEEVKPDLVCVAPEWTDQRYGMIKAALESGAHIISEAPLAQTLKEADELLALAKSNQSEVAVMAPMRLDPHVIKFHHEYSSLIGELKQIRLWGACDDTAGGEDMILTGTQLFDLVRLFAGEVNYCTASVSSDGMAAIAEDAHVSKTRNLGALLGNVIHAEFEMASGIQVSFVSDHAMQSSLGSAGIEFIGTKSRMRLFAGTPVTLSLLKDPKPNLATRADQWEQWPATEGPYHLPVDRLTGDDASNRLVVNDWIKAIRKGESPAASMENALKALEMAHGVWQAAVTMKRAFFPLANRLHPLSEESQ
ncbi:MAG: Gfo/Idh/MocA family oxidoreductase [Verrucomicrobiales bacterium]|nr:Gfo/Idh/MocA family oxidoreductase [Verrucomicrobiales bacterium]